MARNNTNGNVNVNTNNSSNGINQTPRRKRTFVGNLWDAVSNTTYLVSDLTKTGRKANVFLNIAVQDAVEDRMLELMRSRKEREATLAKEGIAQSDFDAMLEEYGLK